MLTTVFAADSEYEFDGDEKNQQPVQAGDAQANDSVKPKQQLPVTQEETPPLSDEQEPLRRCVSAAEEAIRARTLADIEEYENSKRKKNSDISEANPDALTNAAVAAAGDPAPAPAANPIVAPVVAVAPPKLEAKSLWSNTIKLTPGVAINKDSAAYVIIGAEFRDTKLTYSKGSEVSRSSQLTIRPVVSVGCRTALSPNTFLKVDYTAIPEKTFRKSDATTKFPANHSVSVGLNFKF